MRCLPVAHKGDNAEYSYRCVFWELNAKDHGNITSIPPGQHSEVFDLQEYDYNNSYNADHGGDVESDGQRMNRHEERADRMKAKGRKRSKGKHTPPKH